MKEKDRIKLTQKLCAAQIELEDFQWKLIKKYELSYDEFLTILLEEASFIVTKSLYGKK